METQSQPGALFAAFGAKQFGTLQIVLLALLILFVLRFLRRSSPESHFKSDAFQQRKKARTDRSARE
ncbi:MAG: hypothetical protein KGQ59_10320, partial [Bdellovibrionales bacterium]|nr:hypothetical protein [Bdellovibrionales bacterium]